MSQLSTNVTTNGTNPVQVKSKEPKLFQIAIFNTFWWFLAENEQKLHFEKYGILMYSMSVKKPSCFGPIVIWNTRRSYKLLH